MISCVALAMVLSQSYPLQAESFEGKEDEMNKRCSAIYDEKTQSECSAYKDYLVNKKSDADKRVKDLSKQIAAVEGDITKLGSVIEQNNAQLASAQKVLDSIESSVQQTNASITKLKVQIEEKEESIKERDQLMKARLIEMQPYVGSNNFIDFLMGASSFTDLLRRTSIVGELNSYEQEQIALLNKEKKELKLKQDDVTLKKELLEAQKKDANAKKEEVSAIKEANEKLMSVYRKQQESITAQKVAAQVSSGQYASSIPNIDLSIIPDNWGSDTGKDNTPSNGGDKNQGNNANNGSDTSKDDGKDDNKSNNQGDSNQNNGNSNSGNNDNQNSGGNDTGGNSGGGNSGPDLSSDWVYPIQGNFYYSQGTWAYTDGSPHRGIDFGTYQNTGLPIIAPATGIVVAVNDGGWANHAWDAAPSEAEQMAGYPYGAGNGMHMIVNVDGICYGLSFYHLTTGSFTVKEGDIVKQGTMIARSGNAGNSWGPHLHFEVMRLGKMSIKEGVSMFYRYNKDYFYGKYYVNSARCDVSGEPCAIRPENLLGI